MNNEFGKIFRIKLSGASHAKTLGVTIYGAPVDYFVDPEKLQEEINKRKPNNKFTTPRKEEDIPKIEYIKSTSEHYKSIKTIKITFENKNIKDEDYDFVSIPRPSHADYVQYKKYNNKNALLGGGIASGRMTLPIVAAGYIAKDILCKYFKNDLEIKSRIVSIGGHSEQSEIDSILDYCYNNKTSTGAIIECVVKNPISFIGEPFFDSVESMISHAMFSIPGIKGIEFGDGFNCIYKFGHERNDVFIDDLGHTKTNNEGGINGGITNGNDIVFRVAVKPTASIMQEQTTYNFETHQMETLNIKGRHDVCFALRVPIVIEAMTAITLLDLKLCLNSGWLENL